MFSNCVFGSSSVAVLVNCSRKESFFKRSVAAESITLFAFPGQLLLYPSFSLNVTIEQIVYSIQEL